MNALKGPTNLSPWTDFLSQCDLCFETRSTVELSVHETKNVSELLRGVKISYCVDPFVPFKLLPFFVFRLAFELEQLGRNTALKRWECSIA